MDFFDEKMVTMMMIMIIAVVGVCETNLCQMRELLLLSLNDIYQIKKMIVE